jgi:peptide/nickel transport system permease protein
MARYALSRILGAIPVMFGVLVVVFLMVRLVPGDPVQIMLQGRPVREGDEERLRQQLGLDRPIPVQFVIFVGDLARGDLGTSFRTHRPVRDEILTRLPNTLKLAGAGLVFMSVVGITAGVLAAMRRGTWLDFSSMFAAIVAVSVPGFWFGLILILIFGVRLGWFPVSGADTWKHLVLPAVALGTRSTAVLARVTRSTMLDVLSQDHVRTARAKGLQERLVVSRHVVRNSLIPIITLIGLELGILLTGAFIIEAVFAYPGLGTLAIQSLFARDFPMIQGIVLVTAFIYITINLTVDILYSALDPRIRYH